MVLPMYIFGQPVLRKTAEEIDFKDYPNLKELITNMFETLERSEGVGLAAPQVGLPIRLFIVDLDVISEDEPQYKGYRHAFINPEIIEESDEQVSMSEGCLSIPGISVFQHEFDHLEGKMFVDRLSPFRKQMIKNKLIAMSKGKFSAHYKCKPNRG